MERRHFLKQATIGAGAAVAASSLSAPAIASGKRKLKMVTTWPKNFPGLGTSAAGFAKDVEKATDGQIRIKVYAAGELVPAFGVFDAVSQGKADLYHAGDYYWQGKHKSYAFFTTVPFGITANEMYEWLAFGGGQQLWDELSGRFNIKALAGTNTGVQMGGWFKKEINTIDDFQGLRMRIPGLGGEVIKRLGATPVTRPGGEIFLALSQGNIDASEWVGPWNDLAFGFYKVAPYYYTSGFHEPGAAIALGFNKEVWDSLGKANQTLMKTIASHHYIRSLAEYNFRNAKALETLVKKHGVQLRTFSDDIMAQLATTSADVLKDVSQTDDLARRIYESYVRSMKNSSRWQDIAETPYLKARKTVFS